MHSATCWRLLSGPAVALVLGWVGLRCGPGAGTDGPAQDGGHSIDGGGNSVTDAGSGSDGGPSDAGSGIDGGPSDAGSGSDGGTGNDGGSTDGGRPGPHGIYVIDSAAGNGLANIRNKPFVSGYVWRRGSWKNFETSAGVYDFSAIDAVVAALEPYQQKLTLAVSATEVPAYLVNDSSVATWTAPGQGAQPGADAGMVLTAVPWDSTMLTRFEAFMKALGDHPVADATKGNALVPLRQHPVLAQISTPLPGLGVLRFKTPNPTTLSSYSRTVFLDGVVRAIRATVSQFPDKYAYIAFFPLNDSTPTPSLTDVTLARLTAELNASASPRLGFFQENLTGSTPVTTGVGQPLVTARTSTYIMFQACWSWSGNTPSFCTIGANETPGDGMQFGYDNYGAKYFELYVNDIDNTAYEPILTTWAAKVSLP